MRKPSSRRKSYTGFVVATVEASVSSKTVNAKVLPPGHAIGALMELLRGRSAGLRREYYGRFFHPEFAVVEA